MKGSKMGGQTRRSRLQASFASTTPYSPGAQLSHLNNGENELDDLKCPFSSYTPNVFENRKISTLKALYLHFFLTQHPTVLIGTSYTSSHIITTILRVNFTWRLGNWSMDLPTVLEVIQIQKVWHQEPRPFTFYYFTSPKEFQVESRKHTLLWWEEMT